MPSHVAFVFPGASGHVNPSLPIARALVQLGWRVDYVCSGAFQSAIAETGATFYDVDAVSAKIPNVREMILNTLEQYEDPGAKSWALNFGSIALARLVPAFVDFFRQLSPSVVVHPGCIPLFLHPGERNLCEINRQKGHLQGNQEENRRHLVGPPF